MNQKMHAHDNPISHVLNRREAIARGAVGLLTLAGMGTMLEGIVWAQKASVISTPALTEGPYWIDETASAFFRSDVRANTNGSNVQTGLPLQLGLTIAQVQNGVITPLPDAFVYIWHCSASGLYSGEAVENTASDTYLRGYQVSNAHGTVQFKTIYPGWYSGRTVHIHIRVRLYPDNDPTQTPTYDYESQLFFDDSVSTQIINTLSPYNVRTNRDTFNMTDSIYTGASLDADGVTSNAGALTQVRLAADTSHAVASYRFVLNLSLDEPTGDQGGGGGTPPGGGTGGPPPGGGGTPPPGGGMGGPPPGG